MLTDYRTFTVRVTGRATIRPTKLTGFHNGYAEYHQDGLCYEAEKVGRSWYLTGCLLRE
jgi:hypothetical protein